MGASSSPEAGKTLRQVLVTLGVPAVLYCVERSGLLSELALGYQDRWMRDPLVWFGVEPFVSAWFLVVFALSVTRRGRRFRLSTPGAERQVFHWSLPLGLLMAVLWVGLQCLFRERTIGLVSAEYDFSALRVASVMLGWSALSLGAALLINRFGLVNGFVAVVAVPQCASYIEYMLASVGTPRWELGFPALLAASALLAFVLEAHVRGPRTVRSSFAAPLSGGGSVDLAGSLRCER